jgi:hypothetical protein
MHGRAMTFGRTIVFDPDQEKQGLLRALPAFHISRQ